MKNKTITVGGTYTWEMKVSVPEDKIDELQNDFGVGTYHGMDIHNWYEDNSESLDYKVQELGGTMIGQNCRYDVDIDEFDVEEDK